FCNGFRLFWLAERGKLPRRPASVRLHGAGRRGPREETAWKGDRHELHAPLVAGPAFIDFSAPDGPSRVTPSQAGGHGGDEGVFALSQSYAGIRTACIREHRRPLEARRGRGLRVRTILAEPHASDVAVACGLGSPSQAFEPGAS